MPDVKIADADTQSTPGFQDFFQFFPGAQVAARNWPVNQVEINIAELQTVKTAGKSTLNITQPLGCVPDLAGDKKILPGNTTSGDDTSHTFFVFVNGCGIDHAVAGRDCRSDGSLSLYVVGQLIYTKPQEGHFSVVIQKNSLSQNNSSLFVLFPMLLPL